MLTAPGLTPIDQSAVKFLNSVTLSAYQRCLEWHRHSMALGEGSGNSDGGSAYRSPRTCRPRFAGLPISRLNQSRRPEARAGLPALRGLGDTRYVSAHFSCYQARAGLRITSNHADCLDVPAFITLFRVFGLRVLDILTSAESKHDYDKPRMLRRYRCKKCGVEHAPPTGKHCRQNPVQQQIPNDGGIPKEMDNSEMMQLLRDLSARMGAVEDHVKQSNTEQAKTAQNIEQDEDDDSEELEDEPEQEEDSEQLSPQELRKDFKLMARAAKKLAAMNKDDSLDDELPRQWSKGTKSGAAMVASELVKKRIDWPHMHVKRLTAGRRKNMSYSEMKVEEFVYGFLKMLKTPRNKLDKDTMIDILEMLMQDTVDFAWQNALNFYEMVGVDVEMGYMTWQDKEIIQQMRMTYSRTHYPEKKEQQKETPKNQPHSAPAGMRCCAAFQTRSCEQNRDHHPFTHACSYCHKTSTILARHSEEDCFKKIAQESKNGRKTEQ